MLEKIRKNGICTNLVKKCIEFAKQNYIIKKKI